MRVVVCPTCSDVISVFEDDEIEECTCGDTKLAGVPSVDDEDYVIDPDYKLKNGRWGRR